MVMSSLLERDVPRGILFIISLLVIISYYITGLEPISDYFVQSTVILFGISIILGGCLFVRRYIRYISSNRDTETYLRVYALILVFVFIVVGMGLGEASDLYVNLYNTLLQPVGTAFWALLGLYTLSISVRAMRARSIEAGTLLVFTFLVVLKNAPVAIAIFPAFNPIGDFIFDYITKGPTRALAVGAAIGALSIMIRTILGLEIIKRIEEEAEI